MFILCGVSTYASAPSSSLCKTGGHETAIQGFEGNVGKSPRKSQVHLVLIVHVGRIRRKDHERSMACLLGSGTYLECSGCSIANHQSPSESKMVLYWRKKSFQSIQPLCHYAQGGCRRGRLWLTWCLIPWNDLRWQEPHIHSCCPQPPTMILSTCRISSMYSSAEATSNKLASFKSSRQWLCDFQRTILHAVTNWKYPPD